MNTEDVKAIADAIEVLASAVHVKSEPGICGPDGSAINSLSSAVTDIAWVIKDVAEAIERLAIAVEDIRKGGDA